MLLLVNLLIFSSFPFVTFPFNLDVDQPVFRHGPAGSWFGFSLAAHFRQNGPTLLVGAPRAESGQPGTQQAGAIFACDPGISGSHSNPQCSRLAIEYSASEVAEWRRPPDWLHSKKLHFEGKNHQMLGFSVHSSGQQRQNGGSRALACAPLLRWGQNAYTDGVCYLLGPELNQTGILNSCGPLPKKDRHNDYGACEQGFSAYIDGNVILTGLPGARKWTGGVFAKYEFIDSDGFPDSVDRWTMEVDKQRGGILGLLASHDYLGYSIRYGRFGFWHEDSQNFTIVSGATRYNQTGAVLFLPFHRRNFQAEEERQLGLLAEDKFLLTGRQLGSGFGSALEVLDLNADGFDDLIVGAPFEYFAVDHSSSSSTTADLMGGAVYIFYSRGVKQPKGVGHRVFMEPVVLRGRWPHSQFGAALTGLGNLDNDPKGYQDFAVGAPHADSGHGAVLIYHGAKSAEEFVTEPAQQILAKSLRMATKPIRGFGAALAGGVDLDEDGYGELAVGAPSSDTAILFRARPVLEVELGHKFAQKYVKIADAQNRRECAPNGQSCFSLSTSLHLLDPNRTVHRLLARAFPSNPTPFLCRLDIVPFARAVAPRAVFTSNGATQISWPCGGRGAIESQEERTFQLHIPKGNQDWTNPLRFNFSIGLAAEQRRSTPSRSASTTAILPAINPVHRVHLFEIAFDKDCGEDNECHTDMVLTGTMMDLTRREMDGKYQAKVTEKDALVLRMLVENRGERAYLAKLYLQYDDTELDEPSLVRRKKGGGGGGSTAIDIERREKGMAVLALGNPLEAGQKLTFDLLFKLVRGSSERISASLHFGAVANSSSLEAQPADNEWEAEVQLIKEADLQLAGVARPPIVHFSRGNARASDEEDIGPQLVHAFLLTNRGPFYARNVTVKIDWPLRLHSASPNSDWLLYTLEEPMVRHNGHHRRCQQPRAAINPLGIYNDETLKLDYQMKISSSPSSSSSSLNRKPREAVGHHHHEKEWLENEQPQNLPQIRQSSILQREQEGGEEEEGMPSKLWPKSVLEMSGEWVRVVDINCKDGTAHCVQLVCHFDYIGANDSAQIEIRARLWNWTFSAEDHRKFDYISLSSEGFIELDPEQGILEDVANNFARITTHAYPDRPQQEDRLEWWLLALAAGIGLILLGLVILICRCFGFFKRKRRPDLHLHQAHYQKQQEEESIVS